MSTSSGSFLVSVTGQLELLDILAAAGTTWYCKYEFVSGPDWKIVGGLEAGISQTANVITNGEKVVFNMPIEVVYKSTNPYGWPQIVLSVYRDTSLEGYGRVHLPIKPGIHDLKVSLSKPEASSLLGYFCSFFGYQPELVQPKMLASTEGNNLIRMVSNGTIIMSINVLLQGFQTLGYDIGRIK